jgi:hypothetical protein
MRNIFAARKIYPGWKVRTYVDDSVNVTVRNAITTENSEVVEVLGVPGKIAGMFWRFFASNDPMVDRMITRDLDSNVNRRERVLVHEWIRSGKKFHVVRDHPEHKVPMMGGMWGVAKRPGEGVAIDKAKIETPARAGQLNHFMKKKGGDQRFLEQAIWPQAQEDVLAHDAYFCDRWSSGAHPIPIMRRGQGDFVGCSHGAHWDPQEPESLLFPNEDVALFDCSSPDHRPESWLRFYADKVMPKSCRPADHQDWEW